MELIISDLDGTLVYDKRVSNNNLKAIRRWIEAGNAFSVATGRSFNDTQKIIHDINCNFPIIMYNGNMIYYRESNKKVIFKYINENYIKKLKQILDENQLLENLVLFGAENKYVTNPTVDYLNKLYSKKEHFIFNEDYKDYNDKIMSLMIKSSNEILTKIMKLPIDDNEIEIMKNGELIDIIPKGVSKGAALKKIVSGLDFKKIYVMGDNINDVSMAYGNNIVVAVGNATESFKEVADLIVCDSSEDSLDYLLNIITK